MDPNANRNSMGSRAGTAMKPKFGAGMTGAPSRIGTIGKGLNPLGGVGSTVEVKERPMTNAGGINGPQGGNQSRSVYDRTYYVIKTKEKMMSIQQESEKLKAKAEFITKEQQIYNKLQGKLEELNNEVRNLEGQLADYNLSLDKLRTNTRPQDVKNAYHHVKNQNDKLKSELDEIFMVRKKMEDDTEEIQAELNGIHQQMELRLNELDPSQRSEYQKLMIENNELNAEYMQKQGAMEELLNKLANAERKLNMDSQKLKGQYLKKQIDELEAKRSDYQIQLNQSNLSIPEARERILNRMKEDNALITQMEKRNRDAKKNIDIYQKKLRQLQSSLEDKKTEEEDKKKYQILYQKDKQMDDFINSFEKLRSNEIHQIGKIQKYIEQVLEQTSKVLQISNQLPTQGAVNRGDRSQNTIAQTKAEYQIRLNNLRALSNTEKRTQEEIVNLKSNISKMKEEIAQKFDKVEQVKDKLNNKKKKLTEDEKSLSQIKEKIAPTISTSDHQLNITQKKYQMQDQFNNYNSNERKLQQIQSNRYYLKHYISTKSKDTNYQDIKNQCMSFAEELNKKIVKSK